MKRSLIILSALLFWASAWAQDGATPSQGSAAVQPAEAGPPSPPFFKPQGWTFSVYGGNFVVDEVPQFSSIRNEFALGLGVSSKLERVSWLALDLEAFYVNRDYETSVGAPSSLNSRLSEYT